MSMIYAYHTSSATLTKHTNRAGFTIFLSPFIKNETSGGNQTNSSIGGNFTIGNITTEIFGANYDEGAFHRIHGWILWLVWGPLALIQLSTTRYMKTFTYGIWVHMLAGIINMACTFGLGIMAIKENYNEIADHHHARLGLAIIGFVSAVNITGVILRMRIFRRLRIYWIHKIMGYSILIVS